eukprot:CAMPEP_0119565920 /NCGR_PEP_ID=MMETSP1352-20130426/31530_1 /TAXON_ID=265584 /ORGANISM="Stauroneis constricta, Strain CCMP1120" /LENGTH=310 /DNA_ID=CAMNT_0007614941 /DNA_START=107 /DNA_END=1039 /DNA_ORIENTATION=+
MVDERTRQPMMQEDGIPLLKKTSSLYDSESVNGEDDNDGSDAVVGGIGIGSAANHVDPKKDKAVATADETAYSHQHVPASIKMLLMSLFVGARNVNFNDEECARNASIIGSTNGHSLDVLEGMSTSSAMAQPEQEVIHRLLFDNGLPWKGAQCQSLRAGGSGVLYILPVFVCENNRIEQMAWIIQGILSVSADYVFAGQRSVVHGVDRIFAVSMLIIITARASVHLQPWSVIAAVPPCLCFLAANDAKNRKDLESWKWCHFGWHLTGGLLAMMIVYCMYKCPHEQQYHDDGDDGDDNAMVLLHVFCKRDK